MIVKVNFYGEVLKLNKVNDDLWISNAIDEDVCLVFQRYEGVWDRGFYTLDEILAKDKCFAEQSTPCKYKVVLCGDTMGGPLAIDGDGIIQFFYAIPQGRTTMECINHLCESVNRDCKWIAPNQGNGEQDLDQC